MKNKYSLAVYAGDSLYDGLMLGPETIARCNGVISLINESTDDFVIYIAAGMYPGFTNEYSLAELMEQYFTKQLKASVINGRVKFRTSKDHAVWGTIDETLAIANLLKEGGQNKAIVFSSWYHIPRIKYIWDHIDGFDMNYQKVLVPFHLNVLLEPLKWIKVFLKFNT